MLQITPSFGKKYFFFPNGLNYLMMNSNAVEKKKKSWQDNFQLGFNPRGSCGFLLLGGLYALAHSFVWYGYCYVENLAGGGDWTK